MTSAASQSRSTRFSQGSLVDLLDFVYDRSFTALCIAMLVDDGKLSWDTKVQEILPGFKVRDETVSKEATVLDLLVSTSSM